MTSSIEILLTSRAVDNPASMFPKLPHVPLITCVDGFSMSVQASASHYCAPRDNFGPWHQVEIGFPSERVEQFMPYIDGADSDPTNTVYGYVPLELVIQVIEDHGGIQSLGA